MLIMIHGESTSQLRLLPARILLEIAKLEREQKDAAEVKEYNEALDELRATIERSKKYLSEADEETLPPKPSDDIRQ